MRCGPAELLVRRPQEVREYLALVPRDQSVQIKEREKERGYRSYWRKGAGKKGSNRRCIKWGAEGSSVVSTGSGLHL